MVNWYRAIVAKGLRRADAGPIDVPALVIWGNADRYGSKDLARRSLALCTRGEAVYLDTSHWVQHDAPQRVNELLIDFFKDMPAGLSVGLAGPRAAHAVHDRIAGNPASPAGAVSTL